MDIAVGRFLCVFEIVAELVNGTFGWRDKVDDVHLREGFTTELELFEGENAFFKQLNHFKGGRDDPGGNIINNYYVVRDVRIGVL